MIFLWSDILLFLMLACGAVFFLYAMRKEHWLRPLRRLRRNSWAMFCFAILCLYTAVAMVDSVHFRDEKTGSVVSLLDHLASPFLFQKTEKTYSAPLANRAYIKSFQKQEGGEVKYDYAKLEFGGAHLSGGSFVWDLSWRFGLILLLTAAVVLLLRRFLPAEEGRRKFRFPVLLLAALVSATVFTVLLLGFRYHIFGTDKTGADVFFAAVKSIRTGLIIGTLTTLIVTPLAILFGVLAGYLGGRVDDLIQYIYTTLSSIPDILLIAAAMLILRAKMHSSLEDTLVIADKQLVFLCIILGITSWTGLCRLIRGETLKLKNLEYVEAARALGQSQILIMIRHLVPNLIYLVLISLVLRFSGLVLAESVLAYVGIGVDPALQSWGNMINDSRLELARDPAVWWSLLASFLFMFGLVLPANIFGDAVRDALDPRLEGEES